MKIVDVKVYVVGTPPPHEWGFNWVFLKLTTDGGIEGVGEVYVYAVPFQFHQDTVVQLIEDVGERYVIGADPFKIERLWRILYYYDRPNLTTMGVLSAFEMACWDIVGKALNQPVYNLLGGQVHEKLRSYTSIRPKPEDPIQDGWRPYRVQDTRSLRTDPEWAAKRAVEYVKQGFTAIKLNPISQRSILGPGQLSLEALDNAELVVRNVREAVGNKCDLLISNSHGVLTTSSAIRLAKRLEKYDPLWFEEPIPHGNRDEMTRVARSTSIPIATGERLATKYEFRELLEKQAAAILIIELGRVGGILEAKKIAGMAEAYYVQIAPHGWCGPIQGAANIQLATCTPNFLIQEGIETSGGFYAEILKEPIQWEDGYIIPPTKPGLGIELNEEVAAKHPYQQV